MNAIPVFIASDPEWAQKFTDAERARSSATTSRARSAPRSRTACSPACSRTAAWRSTARTSSTSAATWTSRTCSSASGLSRRRSRRRSRSRARSTRASTSDDVHIGPSDHVPWLDDRKWAYIRLEGRNFGDVPLNIELKLEVWDSPNSAGVIIDAVRCAKVALDRGIGGPLARPVGVLHEVAAGAVPRRRGPPDGRGVRRQVANGSSRTRESRGVSWRAPLVRARVSTHASARARMAR